MPSIFDVLEEVEKRPSMYVGWSESERRLQLQNLEMFMAGYTVAVHVHGIDEPVKDFLREFSRYLWVKYEWSVSCGPIAAIRDACQSDEEAWEKFWTLVRDFRASLR